MRDIECGNPSFTDRILDRGKNVYLSGDIKGCRGFVKHHQFRFRAQCHCRHDPLKLTAGHLMRVSVADVFGVRQAKFAEQRHGAGFGVWARNSAGGDGCFGDLIHQFARGVKAGRGGLGHIGDALSPKPSQCRGRRGSNFFAVQNDLACGQPDAAASIGHGRQANGRFSRPTFPDQPHDPSLVQAQAHPLDDHDVLGRFAGGVGCRFDPQVANIQQGRFDLSGRFLWRFGVHPRPPFRLLVRFRIQSATRFTDMASDAMATAG